MGRHYFLFLSISKFFKSISFGLFWLFDLLMIGNIMFFNYLSGENIILRFDRKHIFVIICQEKTSFCLISREVWLPQETYLCESNIKYSPKYEKIFYNYFDREHIVSYLPQLKHFLCVNASKKSFAILVGSRILYNISI